MLTALLFAVIASGADAQVDRLRRARDAALERTPSLASLFGNERALTNDMSDATDAVPSMDGFEPTAYSPLWEMPLAQDGTVLLVPGTYTITAQGFCLQPGTWSPTRGEGYLHTQWKGPRSALIRTVLQRSLEHPEVPQRQVQLLLWAIIARADMTKLGPETKVAASRLLSPAELADLAGYKLGTVPAPVRERVLQGVPPALRQMLEAENEMRRMLTSADAQYAEMERAAVLEGRLPESEAAFALPRGRWSYHPSGYFIRYLPDGYKVVRIDIYYPRRFEIRRDGMGRITDVYIPNERSEVRGQRPEGVSLRSVAFSLPASRPSGFSRVTGQRATALWTGGRHAAPASRVDLLEAALRSGTRDARRRLLDLARADYLDLAALEESMRPAPRAGGASRRDHALIREAAHAALARYLGIAGRETIAGGSASERWLRPARLAGGFVYTIAPVARDESAVFQAGGGAGGYQPGGGGGQGGGQRQRQGTNGRPSSPPRNQQQSAMSTFGQAAKGVGTATNPAAMLGAGLGAASNYGDQIVGGLQGNPPDAAMAPGASHHVARGHDDVRQRAGSAAFVPVSWTRGVAYGMPAPSRRQGGAPEYQVLSPPRTIEFPPVTPDPMTPEMAQAWNAVLGTTFRMAMALEAATIAQTKLGAAVKARDVEWQRRHGEAIVFLKRRAGLEMVRLAGELAALRSLVGSPLGISAEKLQADHSALRTDGFTPAMLAIHRQLRRSDAQLEEFRREVLSSSAEATAAGLPGDLDRLQEELQAYGTYLASLPEVGAPWR